MTADDAARLAATLETMQRNVAEMQRTIGTALLTDVRRMARVADISLHPGEWRAVMMVADGLR